MTFYCTDCGWELPAEIYPVSINTQTGEVTELDPEAVIEDGPDLPDCPDCDGSMPYDDERDT
jgi:hypothetical protein